MRNKKAQTEAMGLMIIVVIVSLAILFAAATIFFKQREDPLQSFIQKKLSSDIIGAMLRTSSGCTEDTTMEDLFIDLAKGSTIQCNLNMLPSLYPNVPECKTIITSEDALKCGVTVILSNTTDEWHMLYHFQAKVAKSVLFEKTGGDLSKSKGGEVTPYTLPIPGGQYLEIWLCMGSKCPEI